MKTLTVSVTLLSLSAGAFTSDHGARIFTEQCAACHGNAGLTMDTPLLHGQEPAYIVKALKAFKSNGRTDTIMMSMNAIASALSVEEIKAVASYIAGQDPCALNIEIDFQREGFRAGFVAGRQLYQETNCGHCHQSFHHQAPRLIGQKASFLTRALDEFRQGKRTAPMMANLLRGWTDADYANVVTYLSGMRLMRSCGEGH